MTESPQLEEGAPSLVDPSSAPAPPLKSDPACPPLIVAQIRPRRRIAIELILFAFMIFVPLVVGAFAGEEHGYSRVTFTSMMTRLIVYGTQMSAMVVFIIWTSGAGFAAFGICRFRLLIDPPLGAAIYVAAFIFSYFAGIATWLLIYEGGPLPERAAAFDFPMPHRASDYALLVIGSAVNGFFEELTMRAYFVTRLIHAGVNKWVAGLASVAVFTLYHFYQGPSGMLNACAMGMVLTTMFLLLRRLWPLAFAHMLGDIVPFLIRSL